MSVVLYMDEHVHLRITIGLRFRDVDVLTVQEDGRSGTPDPLLQPDFSRQLFKPLLD